MLFCFWTNNRILFGSLLVGLPRIKQVLLAVPRAPNARASSKNLSFWLGWTVLVLVLVIAPPKKDNTRTTHTHTLCLPSSRRPSARAAVRRAN